VPTPRIPPEQWTDQRHVDGHDAEQLVGEWFIARGWRVVAHRFRLGRHDLDLIVRQGSLVAFVEVKSRRSLRCGAGEEAVVAAKRATIERVAWAWLVRHGRVGDQYRFDVVSVRFAMNGQSAVRHIPDAWRPGWSR
jgi:putative endonuclease